MRLVGFALDLVSFSTRDSSRRLQGARSTHCRASPSWSIWTQKGWELPRGGMGMAPAAETGTALGLLTQLMGRDRDFRAEDVGDLLKDFLPSSNIHKGTCDPSVNTKEEQAWEQQAQV